MVDFIFMGLLELHGVRSENSYGKKLLTTGLELTTLGLRSPCTFSIRPSYLDLLLPIGMGGQFYISNYDKHDDFNFHIINFPFLSSNIPASTAYGVFFSQLIRYAGACSPYLRATRLSS